MKTKLNIENIIQNLSVLRYIIHYNSSLGHTDLNKHAENFYMEILNKAYGWKLINLNEEKKNHPAIDLGDKKNKIAVQVTSTSTKQKIDDTLDKIKSHGYDNTYDTLYILIITEKKDHKITKERKINFNPEKNLISIDDVIGTISSLGHREIQDISDFISEQINFVKNETALKGSIFDNSSSFQGKKYQNMEVVYNYYEKENFPTNNILKTLKPFIDDLYRKLDKISQKFRQSFLFFITKMRNCELSIENWATMIEKDLAISREVIGSIIEEFEINNLAYDDEGQPRKLYISKSQQDGWLTIIDMYEKEYLTSADLENLIVHRDFSVLDV